MRKKYFILIIAVVLILALGSSLAYLRAIEASENNSNITLSNVQVDLLTDISAVTLNTLVPVSDSVGLTNSPVVFQIRNNGTTISSYKVNLVDKETVSTMSNNSVRYQLTKTVGTGDPEVLPIANLDGDGLIDDGTIEVNQTITYSLIMWIDINANPNNQTFSKYVSVEGKQIASLDKSGANFPEKTDNMIPVYYDQTDATTGTWRVADSKNIDTNYKWFDYDELMWANAVTVKETNGNLQSDRSVLFDGVDDYIDLGYDNYNFGNNFSAVVRFKMNTLDSNKHVILENLESGGFSIEVDSSLKGYLYFNGDSDSTLGGTQSISADTWYTVVLIYDGSTINMYVDGTGLTPVVKSGNINVSTLPIVVGANKGTSTVSDYSNVTVATTLIYKDALTFDEIDRYFTGAITDYPKDNLLIERNGFQETDTRQTYLNAAKGTEIPMTDITSMWVWIPRYKYEIFNGNNGLANEQMINVTFEHGLETLGTVTCQNNILVTTSSASSEDCTDSKYTTVTNNKSSYTHPAFNFGNEKLTGFWIGKFENGTDDATCNGTASAANCSKTDLNIIIKPGEKPLRYITVSNMFANTRRMESFNNIHGFSQNKDATTFLDASNQLTGDILNDSNTLDTHIIKNMEWGAVAYLSQSKYGKYGNNLYTGTYKEVYNNNHSSYFTGYSGGTFNTSSSTTNTFPYNDLTDQGSGKGYKGAGASTTGNIYGVYDMNGGVGEFAMGNHVNSSNQFVAASAGTWSTTVYPVSKYYDVYSYNSNSTTYTGAPITRGKLGDATKEVVKAWSSSGRWNSDYNYMIYGTTYAWFARGGYYSQTGSGGVFASYYLNGAANQYYGSRSILTVSRNTPWTNE